MSKIAIDLGHGVTYDRGAADGFIQEEQIINDVGQLVINYLRGRGHEIIEVRPESATSVANSLIKRVDKANEYQVDLYVSIHANAGNGVGSEVFTYQGKELAEARNVLKNLVHLGFVDRGIKGTSLYVTHYTDAPSMLIEICFTDTQSDVDLYNSIGVERIANAIVNGITGDEVLEPTPAATSNTETSISTGTIIADVLNVRETPGGTIIGSLNSGDTVKIDREEGDWYSIYFGDHGGYVSKRYVAINGLVVSNSSNEPALDGTIGKVTASQLNVRDGIMGSIVGQLNKGDTVKICRQESNWYHIYYGDHGAWVSADYVEV